MTTKRGRVLTKYNNLSFRNKLVVTYFIAMLVPVVLLMLLFNGQASSRWSEKLLANTQIQVNEYIDKIGQRADRAEMAARIFALDNRTIDILQREYGDFYYFAKDYMDVIFPTFTMIRYILPELTRWWLYTDGPLQHIRTFGRPLQALLDQPWFDSAIRQRQFVWYTQENTLRLGIRQADVSFENRVNFIVLDFAASQFFEGIELVGVDHAVQVLDMGGNIVYERSTLEGSGSIHAGDAPVGQPVRVDGERYETLGGKLTMRGWSIRYYVPSRVFAPPMGWAFALVVSLLLLVGICLAMIGFLLSKTLIRRMEALNNRVRAVVTLGQAQDLRTGDMDEIGELSNSVATMMEKTNRLTREMYENQLALREAEFKVLQTQIKPHFLYNSLSLINWRAIRNGDHETSQMALMLTQYYRTMLNQGRSITTVREEWLNMEAYLHMQTLLHNRNFETDMYLDEHLAEYPAPNLILQPLVENAIEHGLDKLRDTPGRLYVRGTLAGDDIHFEVRDNGPGFSEESLTSALTVGASSYCLKNIQDRLRLIYGEAFRFTLGNTKEGGAFVVIEIPTAGPRMKHIPLLRMEQEMARQEASGVN